MDANQLNYNDLPEKRRKFQVIFPENLEENFHDKTLREKQLRS